MTGFGYWEENNLKKIQQNEGREMKHEEYKMKNNEKVIKD
jgi:hypothetical protein